MNERTDYLNRPASGENPFKLPEAYFEGLEDRLLARIAEEEKQQEPVQRPVWRILKPALALAATFALIFGMGYGVLALTHTLDGRGENSESRFATVEEELIRPVSIINYYQSEGFSDEEAEIDEESILSFLASELSYGDLTEIYAQSYRK